MWRKLPWLLIVIVGLLIVAMAGTAVWLLQHKNAELNNDHPDQSLLDEREERSCGLPSAKSVAATTTVQITGVGFNPAEVAIKVGQTVRWENSGTSPHRVVVGPHPLHNQCLGLDSKELAPHQSFGFTFTKPGEWTIHDENLVSNQAKIIVTE